MKKIKFIFTLILVIGLYSFGFTQVIKPKVQATIKPNPVHPHCVDIFAKADKGVESEAIMGIVISISILTSHLRLIRQLQSLSNSGS